MNSRSLKAKKPPHQMFVGVPPDHQSLYNRRHGKNIALAYWEEDFGSHDVKVNKLSTIAVIDTQSYTSYLQKEYWKIYMPECDNNPAKNRFQ